MSPYLIVIVIDVVILAGIAIAIIRKARQLRKDAHATPHTPSPVALRPQGTPRRLAALRSDAVRAPLRVRLAECRDQHRQGQRDLNQWLIDGTWPDRPHASDQVTAQGRLKQHRQPAKFVIAELKD